MSTQPHHTSTLSDPATTGTILLVEDEAPIRTLISRILRRRGYVVLEAVDGPDALGVAAAYEAAIDVLLTDLVMPGIGGARLAQRIGETRPGLCVIYMSGYGVEDLAAHGVAGGAHFLAKPFRPDELVAKVDAALD
jgi:two-component system, cell cycle sensor histidine kinase and response regulator CckA